MNRLWQKFFKPKDHNKECSRWVLHSILWLCQFNLSAWVIRKKYVELLRHANPCIHNSENHMSFELSLVSCFLTSVYQFVVRSSRAFVLSMPIILVVRQDILFLNDYEKQTPAPHPFLGLVKVVVFRRSKCQSSFCSVLPWSVSVSKPADLG